MTTSPDTEVLLDPTVENEIKEVKLRDLILYNDDYNTFDWVIKSLIDVCCHSAEQAEQLSLLTHFKGKATVKTASHDVLQPLKDSLTERGLSAVIESDVKH